MRSLGLGRLTRRLPEEDEAGESERALRGRVVNGGGNGKALIVRSTIELERFRLKDMVTFSM